MGSLSLTKGHGRFQVNMFVKLVLTLIRQQFYCRAKVEDGGYKRKVRMVAHMEMFLKDIKPALFLLFFAGQKLFIKEILSFTL